MADNKQLVHYLGELGTKELILKLKNLVNASKKDVMDIIGDGFDNKDNTITKKVGAINDYLDTLDALFTVIPGAGIAITDGAEGGNIIAVKKDPTSEAFLEVTDGGVAIKGVQTAIDAACAALEEKIITGGGFEGLNEAFDTLKEVSDFLSGSEGSKSLADILEAIDKKVNDAKTELQGEIDDVKVNYVPWSDKFLNRIVLKYASDAKTDRAGAGEGAGQIIGMANPDCKEDGDVWSDTWKEQEVTDAYKKKYPYAASPNVYKENAPAVVLVQMSKYNVQEYGSPTYPINLQGSKKRPTYNDDEQIALMSDLNAASNGLDARVTALENREDTAHTQITATEVDDWFDA